MEDKLILETEFSEAGAARMLCELLYGRDFSLSKADDKTSHYWKLAEFLGEEKALETHIAEIEHKERLLARANRLTEDENKKHAEEQAEEQAEE